MKKSSLRRILRLCFWSYLVLLANGKNSLGQPAMGKFNSAQQRAMDILNKADTISASPLWPHINPALFFGNIRKNILYPEKLYQGSATNFCSYAALSVILISYQPEAYVQTILSLYRTGKAALHKKTIAPSKRVRDVAGALKHKGDLEILHADQLWFLSLADNFKGYLNVFDHRYDQGDENTFWSATNYRKFNRMLRKLGNCSVKTAGSDLFRPLGDEAYQYIVEELHRGIVLLFINNKLMHPSKYSQWKLPVPTHYIVLYDMYKLDDMIELKYWDYGLKTELLITERRLQKMVFGITQIKSR
jgi:hypothetical protein